MDILMLIAPRATSVGYEGKGDFSREASGRLRRRGEGERVPYVYAGVAIVKPEMTHGTPDGPFSANLFYDRAIAEGRLYGVELDGQWLHVGEPHAIAEAEACLTAGVR
jgi:MurNAc alpha-1-phosphate uridylyltransferase